MTDQTTTRLAETATRLDAARNTYYTELATLSDEALERIRSHARAWREAHDVHPDELMDIDLLLTDVDTYRAREANLLSRVGQLQGQLDEARAERDKYMKLTQQWRLAATDPEEARTDA